MSDTETSIVLFCTLCQTPRPLPSSVRCVRYRDHCLLLYVVSDTETTAFFCTLCQIQRPRPSSVRCVRYRDHCLLLYVVSDTETTAFFCMLCQIQRPLPSSVRCCQIQRPLPSSVGCVRYRDHCLLLSVVSDTKTTTFFCPLCRILGPVFCVRHRPALPSSVVSDIETYFSSPVCCVRQRLSLPSSAFCVRHRDLLFISRLLCLTETLIAFFCLL